MGMQEFKDTFKIVAAVLIFGLSAFSVKAGSPLDEMVIMTEDYPPYNFRKDDELKGISTDIMVELLERSGSEKTRTDIEELPWARGYNLAMSQDNHILFSTTRTESREELFKWVGPFVPTAISVIAKKERGLKIETKEDLYKLRIGVVKDDIGQLLLKEAGMPNERVEPVLLNEQNYKKLFAGRIDAIAYEDKVAAWQIAEMGQDPSDYEPVFQLKQSELYLALHRGVHPDIVNDLQAKLDEMKADGTHQQIIEKYALSK